MGNFGGGPGEYSPVKARSLNREPLRSPRGSRASARQSRVVDVLPLLFRRVPNRLPDGEHLEETGARGEPRVVVRREIDEGDERALRTRGSDAMCARSCVSRKTFPAWFRVASSFQYRVHPNSGPKKPCWDINHFPAIRPGGSYVGVSLRN
jgi:hypothetical protein